MPRSPSPRWASLAGIGVQTVLVADGQQALDRVRREAFDIVFLDIHMPVLSGPEAAQRIWSEMGDGAPHLVGVSASVPEHERQQYLDLGFEQFIDKPFRAERVFGCLCELLGVEFAYAVAPAACPTGRQNESTCGTVKVMLAVER